MHFLGTGEHILCLEQVYGCLFQPLYTVHILVVHLTTVCTVQLINNRFASLEVSLTILKTETHTEYRIQNTDRQIPRGGYRARPGLTTRM